MSKPPERPTGSTSREELRRGRTFLVLSLVFTLIVSGAAAIIALRPATVPVARSGADMANCRTQDALTCVPEAAYALAEQKGPTESLNAVRVLLETRPDLRPACHELAHEVGTRFLLAYGEEAIVPGNEWCSYGYYHGLMQAHGKQNPDQLVAYASKVCTSIADNLTKGCMHGLGHASYAATGSIGEAMRVCEQVEGVFARTCADAVIMEVIFFSGEGRRATSFSQQDCLAYDNQDVLAGCAQGLAPELTRRGLDLESSCAIYMERGVYQYCADGYGTSLAANYHSGAGSANLDQLASCATSALCATGFGGASYLYLLDLFAAENACRRQMDGAHLQRCLASAREASRSELLER